MDRKAEEAAEGPLSGSACLIRSPVLAVVWDGERVRLFCPGAKQGVAGLPPLTFELLAAFASPRTVDEVANRFSQAQREEAITLIGFLEAVGALQSPRASVRTSFHAQHQVLLKVAALSSDLAAELYGLADDLEGADPPIEGAAVEQHLTLAAMQLQRLLTLLERVRTERVGRRMAALPANLLRTPLKLHLGAGTSEIPGWINIDGRAGGKGGWLATNLRAPLPFADASADWVFSCHVLEHLAYPAGALALLREVRRVLRPGGVVRLVVPDMHAYARAYVDQDRGFLDADARWCDWVSRTRTPLEQILRWAGCGNEPFFGHKFGYDLPTLAALLREAGLDEVEQSAFMQSRHENLRVDEHSAAAAAAHEGRSFSLFVEATAPG